MARITCRIEETYVENDEGREVEGVVATCSHCGRQTQAYGQGEGSRRRCLVEMSNECREEDRGHRATNYYIAD